MVFSGALDFDNKFLDKRQFVPLGLSKVLFAHLRSFTVTIFGSQGHGFQFTCRRSIVEKGLQNAIIPALDNSHLWCMLSTYGHFYKPAVAYRVE